MNPSDKEIRAEIEWLKEHKSKIPRLTGFGDNNHDAIDAQIEVLSEGMDEDEIEARFGVDETAEEFSETDRRIYDEARDAYMWMSGEDDDLQPSKNWQELVKK